MDDSEYNAKLDQGQSRFSKFGAFLGTAAKAAAAAGAGAVVAAGTVGLSTAAQMEQAEIGFTTMLGSGAKAEAFLGGLSAFAAKTPFAFPELQTAASSLISAGVNANKVIPIMTSLGNATSGMGTGSEGVKRATVALQQMNAAGKITGEDLNQLRDAGIPVYDLLAAATGKSKEAVAELAQKGKLGRTELTQLMTALESGKGLEKFTGLMEAQSASLTGQWSTLKDTFSMGMAEAIQPLIPLIKDGMGGATAFLAGQIPRLVAGIASIVGWAREAYSVLFQGDFKGGLVAGLAEDSKAVGVLFSIRETAIGLYDILFRGDFTGGFLGLEEDSGAVAALFTVREVAVGLGLELTRAREYASAFWQGLRGDGEGAQLGVTMDQVRDASASLQERLWMVRDAVAGMFPPAGSAEFQGRLEAVERAGVATRNGLSTVREAVAGLFPQNASGGVDFAATLDKVEAGAQKVWPALQAAGDSLGSLGPVVTVTAGVFGFLADHIDTIVQYMPLIIAAFIAWKTAQALSLAVQIAHLPVTIALAVSNIAYANAVWALLAAMGIERTSRMASIAAWAVHLVQIIAHNAALLALRAGIILTAAATGAITAAQWLFNAALTANPIGLVIAAIALLVGGLVIAYRESETFRNIVDGAFQLVKTGVGNAVGFMIDGFRMLLNVWLTVAGGIVSGAATALGWVPGVGDKLKGAERAFGAMKDTILGTLDDAAQKAYGFGEKAGGNVAGGFGSQSGPAYDAGRAVGGAAVAGAGAGGSEAYKTGEGLGVNIGNGLAAGINTRQAWINQAAREAARAAASGVSQELEMQSPSRVTMRLGQMFGMGMELGMLSRVGPLGSAGGQIAAAAASGVQFAAAPIPGVSLPGRVRGGDGSSLDVSGASGPSSTEPQSALLPEGSAAAVRDQTAELRLMSRRQQQTLDLILGALRDRPRGSDPRLDALAGM